MEYFRAGNVLILRRAPVAVMMNTFIYSIDNDTTDARPIIRVSENKKMLRFWGSFTLRLAIIAVGTSSYSYFNCSAFSDRNP
jgi:hypothetical protein